MISRIPDDFINGGDQVTGASALTTAGCVPYVASPGVLTEDQYFKYVQIPGSPLAGNTYNRLNLTDSAPPSGGYYDVNCAYDLSIRRTYTSLPVTPTSIPRNIASIYTHSSFNLAAPVSTLTAGAANFVVDTPVGSTVAVGNLYGVAGNVTNNGTGLIGELDGLYYTAFNPGGNISFTRGIYVGAATYGAGNITSLRGADIEATAYGSGVVTQSQSLRVFGGNWGTTGGGGVTTHSTVDVTTQTDGPVTTLYAIRSARGGSVDPSTAWGLSEETGWNNRLLGKTAIGPSYSTAPTNTLQVKDATATTGATSVLIDIGAAQTADSTVLTLNGVLKYAGTNTTGAKSAALGSNCPATTETAPYTWFRMVSSDGSTVYVPAWK